MDEKLNAEVRDRLVALDYPPADISPKTPSDILHTYSKHLIRFRSGWLLIIDNRGPFQRAGTCPVSAGWINRIAGECGIPPLTP